MKVRALNTDKSVAWGRLEGAGVDAAYVDLRRHMANRARPLPFSLRIVLENLLRRAAASPQSLAQAMAVRDWHGGGPLDAALEVSRVIMPDSSGLPALMDLAAARDVLRDGGGDPSLVEPRVPVDLIIDHSLIVDAAGSPWAAQFNVEREFERNAERYAFFKWAEQAFRAVRVAPPGKGIIHQIHLERIARLVMLYQGEGDVPVAGPEFVLGCDSHTPMINGLGLLAWGVGGIDAEAAMLGEPYVVRIPAVVGVRLTNCLPAGATATDLVLTVTERLRAHGVVGAFVEFFGPGAARLAVPDRATIANMAPEYGATIGYFPIDDRTIDYLRRSGRSEAHVTFVERYARSAGLFAESGQEEPVFDAVVDLDLSTVGASVAGPRRPHERQSLNAVKERFRDALTVSGGDGGFDVPADAVSQTAALSISGRNRRLGHGALVIAAITSCTNTSNPGVMLAAGLLARNAIARGLSVPPGVKTSMAPGSRLVADYLDKADLLTSLETLGFHIVGFGCTTCSGKSGDIDPTVEQAIREEGLVGVAVLSGNRNFEGRIHPSARAAYLASPPLVVAYALAGRIDIDFDRDPLGSDNAGRAVYLADLWPDPDELEILIRTSQNPDQFDRSYAGLFEGSPEWHKLQAPDGPYFPWRETSEYIKRPPFFDIGRVGAPDMIAGARAIARFGDALTTDHITPSGAVAPDSVAGRYLIEKNVRPKDFNAVTQRRGNHAFMARVTFGNPRLRNLLIDGVEGGLTRLEEGGDPVSIYEAARSYRCSHTPLLVIAGKDYGMGSSRDWAAKGPKLLGVQAVLAVSFERIHRANLIGVGIVPLTFEDGVSAEVLGLTGFERFDFVGLFEGIRDGAAVDAVAYCCREKSPRHFRVRVDARNESEKSLLLEGGMFAKVMRRLMSGEATRCSPNGATG
ncbi:MAG: aconitate hydratase AcnA [Alphaproteobacteria bacterium]|nr:aconitate hydratase AcnA [Alphaproteobacteria bacterium]